MTHEEHPDFPRDPETGGPARAAEELQTDPDMQLPDHGMDSGQMKRVFEMKQEPLDDSDDEALETFRRYTDPERT